MEGNINLQPILLGAKEATTTVGMVTTMDTVMVVATLEETTVLPLLTPFFDMCLANAGAKEMTDGSRESCMPMQHRSQ